MPLILCTALFFVLLVSISIFGYARYARPARMIERLQTYAELSPADTSNADSGGWNPVTSILVILGNLIPSSPVEAALRRRELSMAGFRSDQSIPVFNGLKLVLTTSLVLIGLYFRTLAPNSLLKVLMPIGLGVIGFKLADVILTRLITRRQMQIRLALADALDMLVVCCEAGCALDQAILNVSREFKVVHPAMSEEFSMVNMELLAGSSRVTALRNLATRTGEEETKKLVAILIQTDRFGTSVADALRTQADFMRIKRRQLAEEKAGKVGVKLVFPIFFFCMPSLAILVIGPGLLQLMKNFLPAMNGMK